MQTVRLIDMGRTWTEAAKLILPTVPAGGERIKYPPQALLPPPAAGM